jgi:hypothetical protein
MKTRLGMKIKTGAFALALTMVANVTVAQYPPASHLATKLVAVGLGNTGLRKSAD